MATVYTTLLPEFSIAYSNSINDGKQYYTDYNCNYQCVYGSADVVPRYSDSPVSSYPPFAPLASSSPTGNASAVESRKRQYAELADGEWSNAEISSGKRFCDWSTVAASGNDCYSLSRDQVAASVFFSSHRSDTIAIATRTYVPPTDALALRDVIIHDVSLSLSFSLSLLDNIWSFSVSFGDFGSRSEERWQSYIRDIQI